MSKHTPGPWEIHEENTILGPKLDEKAVWLRPIVLQSKTGIKPENARLIAAAPDLLKALEALLDCAIHGFDMPNDNQFALNARAAIERAHGITE